MKPRHQILGFQQYLKLVSTYFYDCIRIQIWILLLSFMNDIMCTSYLHQSLVQMQLSIQI